MDVFPDEIFKLFNLHDLDLSWNTISYIPADIKDLVNLRKFIMSNNKLEAVPVQLFECPNIVILEVAFNLISKLPRQIGDMKQLKR